jgi:hypothetical protein
MSAAHTHVLALNTVANITHLVKPMISPCENGQLLAVSCCQNLDARDFQPTSGGDSHTLTSSCERKQCAS